MKNRLTCGLGLSCLLAVGLVLWSATPGVGQSEQSIPTRLSALQGQIAGLTQQIAALTQQMNGQAQHLTQLQTQVDGLGNPAVPFVARVHCNDGDTVAAALAQAALYIGPAEIVIYGVCHEAVVLRRSNTKLWGGWPGSGLNPGADAGNALEVTGAWAVEIHDLTLTGATEGLAVEDSQVTLYSSSVVDNVRWGIGLYNSTLYLRDGSTVARNGYVGIELWWRAAVTVGSSTITNNGSHGIRAWNGSFVGVTDTRIAGNRGVGITAFFNSAVSVHSSVLEDNGTGVGASGMVSMYLDDSVTIQGNHGDGVHLADITAVFGGNPVIRNNEGWGVSCVAAPAVAQIGTARFGRFSNNTLGDVGCPRPQ